VKYRKTTNPTTGKSGGKTKNTNVSFDTDGRVVTVTISSLLRETFIRKSISTNGSTKRGGGRAFHTRDRRV